MKKRPDLQGIRGMAISSVLLYHFYPNIFKSGYVGVDQFFILSGFLMAEILSRETGLSLLGLFSFYYRRMKRILPLYVLFIFSTLLFSILLFPFSTFFYNVPHAIRSLIFISNTKPDDSKLTHERMLSEAENLFVHTWSLSCEVQLYFMAPFFILMPGFCCRKSTKTIFFIIVSYTFMMYNFLIGSPYIAFNNVFSRIWQFGLGILCSNYRENDKVSEEEDSLLPQNIRDGPDRESSASKLLFNLTLFSILFISWFPFYGINPHLVRLLVCLQTAGIICSGQIFPNSLLSNRIAVYLGDISYSLYLIHWPIYVGFKQNSSFGLFASIFLAIFIHEFYEKFYLKLEKKAIFGLCAGLYLACFVVLVPNLSFKFAETLNSLEMEVSSGGPEYYVLPKNLTLESTIALNEHFSAVDLGLLYLSECNYTKFRVDEQLGWTMCQFKNTEFTGSKRLMFVGNSYSPNIARMFIKLRECQQKAGEIFMYTRMACEVLDNTVNGECKTNVTNRYYEAVKEIRPDILFITDRHLASMEPSKNWIDSNFEAEKRYLDRIEKEVKEKVYILNALPRPIFTPKYTTMLNKGIMEGRHVEHNLLTDQSANYKLARNRMAKLAKICSKCEFIDLMPSFTKNGVFQMYDEKSKVQYFTNPLHLNNYGLQKVSPVYRKICNSL